MWIIKNSAFLARSTQDRSSMIRVMMFLMNPSIEYYFALISIASVSSHTIRSEAGIQSYPGSKCI